VSNQAAGTLQPKKTRPGGTLYRGREGMWSWVLHRITGVAIFFFLLVHVLDTSLIRVSPQAYNAVIGTYKNPIMGLGEIALVGAIVFHAFNGLRIIAVDWSGRKQGAARHIWAAEVAAGELVSLSNGRTGVQPAGDLAIFQGPLLLVPTSRPAKLFLEVENAEIHAAVPVTPVSISSLTSTYLLRRATLAAAENSPLRPGSCA